MRVLRIRNYNRIIHPQQYRTRFFSAFLACFLLELVTITNVFMLLNINNTERLSINKCHLCRLALKKSLSWAEHCSFSKPDSTSQW